MNKEEQIGLYQLVNGLLKKCTLCNKPELKSELTSVYDSERRVMIYACPGCLSRSVVFYFRQLYSPEYSGRIQYAEGSGGETPPR
jgi:hypothetical protein